jgi:hypothetical protein
LAAVLLLWPAPRRAVATALFLPDLVPGISQRPLTWWTRAPTRRTVAFGPVRPSPRDIDSGRAPATDAAPASDAPRWDGVLFLPAGRGPHPGLVIALGVTPAGRDDPRVVSLGDGLARLGIAAFVPYSANLEGKRVTTEEIDFLVAAHRTLATQEAVDAGRVGYFGFCVGASLALLAAGDPRIAEDVAVLGWFGGYDRLDRLFVAVTSESVIEDGRAIPWQPDPLAREVVREQLLALLPTAEREAVERALAARAASNDTGAQPPNDDPARPIPRAPSADALTSAGAAVFGLLSAPDRATAERLLAQLPEEARATMDALSPATRATSVQAPVYVMSDTGDALIPAGETEAIAAALGERVARRTVFTVFSHVDLDELDEPTQVARELAALYGQVFAVVGELR